MSKQLLIPVNKVVNDSQNGFTIEPSTSIFLPKSKRLLKKVSKMSKIKQKKDIKEKDDIA